MANIGSNYGMNLFGQTKEQQEEARKKRLEEARKNFVTDFNTSQKNNQVVFNSISNDELGGGRRRSRRRRTRKSKKSKKSRKSRKHRK